MSRSRTAFSFAAVFLLLAVALTAGCGFEADLRRRAAEEPIAVTLRSAILRKGDGPSFAPRRDAPLPAGVEMKITLVRGQWSQIELADGSLGWLPSDAIQRLHLDGRP